MSSTARTLLAGRESDGYICPLTEYRVMRSEQFATWCDKCYADLIASVPVGREAVWAELPAVFGFDSWDVLFAENEKEVMEVM